MDGQLACFADLLAHEPRLCAFFMQYCHHVRPRQAQLYVLGDVVALRQSRPQLIAMCRRLYRSGRQGGGFQIFQMVHVVASEAQT